jgi:peptidoglycan/LPS O-acetylase OafA/YrhL
MIPGNPGRQYYPALDGLRGLAILLVVVYHNFGFIDIFFFGWLGVDLFFVLSGFLITDILLKTLGNKKYLYNFYMRRMLRIFPLFYLCLVLFLIVIPRMNPPFDLSYYTDNQVWLWTYMQNWLYIFKDSKGASALHHLWSLSVEEQFYLVWPLVILLLRKPPYLMVFIMALLLAALGLRLWIWNNEMADLAYFNLYTFTRIDGLCIGCMIALLQRINTGFLKKYTTVIVLFFAGLNFAFFFINRNNQFSFPYLAIVGYTTFAMIFGLLVNEAVTGNSKLVNFIFNIPLLKFFGRISYSFYVLHWPVFLLLSPWLYTWVRGMVSGSMLPVAVALLATLTGIGISWLSYRYFESYFLKMKDRFS